MVRQRGSRTAQGIDGLDSLQFDSSLVAASGTRVQSGRFLIVLIGSCSGKKCQRNLSVGDTLWMRLIK